MYGHERCMSQAFAGALPVDELERSGNIRLLPESWAANIAAHCKPMPTTPVFAGEPAKTSQDATK